MKTEIAKSIPDLLTMSQDAAKGAALVGQILNLVHNNQSAIEADITTLLTRRDAYEAGKVVLSTRRATVRSLFDSIYDQVSLTRDVFKPILGKQHSDRWTIAGFADSIAIPATPDAMQPMLQSIVTFLTANPTYEVLSLNVTATNIRAMFDDLSTARAAVNAQEVEVGNLLASRDDAADQLRRRLRDLMNELAMRMGPLDQRWKAFGFNLPGADATPDVVTGVKVTLIGPTAAAVKWNAAPRAEYYRVFRKVHGSNEDYVAAGSPADLDFTIENLPANSTIEIVVSAVNNGGESALSEPILVTTH